MSGRTLIITLGELRTLVRESLVLSPREQKAVKDWSWHSSSQRQMSSADLNVLKALGQRIGARPPKTLYRAVRVDDTPRGLSDQELLKFGSGVKSWSKTQAGATYYLKANSLSGRPHHGIVFKWHPRPDDVFLSFDALSKTLGTDVGADAGEFMASMDDVVVASRQAAPVHGRGGDATWLFVDVH